MSLGLTGLSAPSRTQGRDTDNDADKTQEVTMQMSPELAIGLVRRADLVTHPGPSPEGGVSWYKSGRKYEWCYGTMRITEMPANELAKLLNSKLRRGDDWSRLHAKRVAGAVATIRATPRG